MTDYSSVTVRGDLAARSSLLSSRLEAPMYRPDEIYTIESQGWPGDWEGRTILALTSLCKTTKREAAYLDDIVSGLKTRFNEKGYLKYILPEGEFNEQQLSGHSWLLRGLCEYYTYRRSPEVLLMINGIVRGLFLPALGKYESYPVSPEERLSGDGQESGSVAGKIGPWHISTDTGCAFIPLDGLTHAYEILSGTVPEPKRDKELASLIDSMIEKFMTLPFLESSVQTHATLTACRGILRRYRQTDDERLLGYARRIFAMYEEHGMTANYENFNWFKLPKWTEPCAIIDSFMVASELWHITNEPHYGNIAELILYNGMLHTQRNNGGFGCDTCAEDGILSVHCYEAYWCCSMRGGEGLAAAAAYAVADDGRILYLTSGDYYVCGKSLKIRTDYPHSDKAYIEYDGVLKLFLPDNVTFRSDSVTSVASDHVTLDIRGKAEIDIELKESKKLYKGRETSFIGPLMLGERGGNVVTLDRDYLLSAEELSAPIKIFGA